MENKENEGSHKNIVSKIPLLIKALPKSNRPTVTNAQQYARNPLKTICGHTVNHSVDLNKRIPSKKHYEGKLLDKVRIDRSCDSYNPEPSRVLKNIKALQTLQRDRSRLLKRGYSENENFTSKLAQEKQSLATEKQKSNEQNVFQAGSSKIVESISSNDKQPADKLRLPVISALQKEDFLFVTPPLELKSEKKVKRSLKRPHSRGLLCLPPLDGDDSDSNVSRNLFTEPTLNVSSSSEPHVDMISRHYTSDALNHLLNIEKRSSESHIDENSRSCVVNYIIQVNGTSGNPATAQSAIWYFDKCCYSTSIDQLKLIGASCYWISNKFYGNVSHGMRLVRRANYAFTLTDLITIEKYILKSLNFPKQPVVPQDFIPYLSWWCDQAGSGFVESAASFLCLCGMTVTKSLAVEYPSAVAAAAVKTAVVVARPDNLAKLETCPLYQWAQKKATKFEEICLTLRRSVQKMFIVGFEHKAAIFQYSVPPHYVAPSLVSNIFYDDTN